MFIWIVVGILAAGFATHPSNLDKGEMKAVFKPQIERWDVNIARADGIETRHYEAVVRGK